MGQRVVWTSVFADGVGGGNPCPVVFGADGERAEQLQALAAAFATQTVFVLAPQSGGDPGRHTWRVARGRAMGRPSVLSAEARTDDSGAALATRIGGSARVEQRDERRF